MTTYYMLRFSQKLETRPSYWHTPSNEPLSPLTLGQLVEQAAQRWGEREALVSVYQGHRISFIQVLEQVDRLAAGFLQLGLKPGDRLGLWGPNSSEWYLTYLAAGRAGLILVNINPAYQIPELEYCLVKVGVKILVAAESFKTQNYHQLVQGAVPELVSCPPGQLSSEKVPELTTLISISEQKLPGAFRFRDIMESASSTSLKQIQELQTEIQPDEGCNLQFTSGTTGQPKGALLSHHNVVNNSYFSGKRLGLDLKHHRICIHVPFFHSFANVLGIMSALHDGSTLVLPDAGFNPLQSIKTIQEERCSIVYGTPTMFVDMISNLEELQTSLPSLNLAMCGGALCSPQLHRQIFNVLQAKTVYCGYGMTETSPVSFMPTPEDSLEKCEGNVGKVMDHIEVKIVDGEGHIVPMGMPGELCVRGYLTMLGYWADVDKTKEILGPDRWLRTGDQFILTEDGYGRVVGRIKDMIIRGGENIFPKEIEESLQTHPDVIEAQVFGVADERWGEEVGAYVRLKSQSKVTSHDLQQYCKGQIAHFKIPKYIRFVKEFPKTATGKIQKFKLSEMLQHEIDKKK